MNPYQPTLWACIAAIVITSIGGVHATAADSDSKTPAATTKKNTAQPAKSTKSTKRGKSAWSFKYRPPKRSYPKLRVSGGTRGTKDPLPVVWVVAPETVGVSATDQPTLWWYQSKPVKATVFITIEELKTHKLIYSQSTEQESAQGFHKINLADANVRLESGKLYRWNVGISRSNSLRSNDPFASGGLIFQSSDSPNPEHWYNIADALLTECESNPSDEAASTQRRVLFAAVDLGTLNKQLAD